MGRIGAWRSGVVLVAALVLAALGGSSTQAASPGAAHATIPTFADPGSVVRASAAKKITSHESGIKFTANTVAIPRSAAGHNLMGVSATGVFKFRHATGRLATLRKGKVMLLVGSDALVVTGIGHSHGHLLVHTKPASLPQLIKSGTLKVSGTPNFRNAFVAPIITSPTSAGSADITRAGYPYVGLAPDARAAAGFSFSVQGSAGAFGYSLSFTPSASRLDVSGVICFQWGSICSNGPSNGLSLELNISGYIDVGSDQASVTVNGGRITNSTINLSDLHAHLKLTYTAARGTGADTGGDPPVFRLPIGIDYTIPGEIPIYIKVQTSVLFKLGLSAKNTVLRGGVQFDSTDSDQVTDAGSHVSGTGSGGGPSGNILDAGDGGTGSSVALAPGGVVVAVQFPKIGLGLGVRALNAIGYLDMITSIGQTAAGFLGGGGCTYQLDWSEGGGFEAQAGPFAVATPRKILIPTSGQQFSKQFSAPGC